MESDEHTWYPVHVSFDILLFSRHEGAHLKQRRVHLEAFVEAVVWNVHNLLRISSLIV